MTREEAAEFTRKLVARAETIVFPKTPKTINNIPVFYFEAVLPALCGPQPDPDTGLMPCGCGGKAYVQKHPYRDTFTIQCRQCGMSTRISVVVEPLKKEWNTALGYPDA